MKLLLKLTPRTEKIRFVFVTINQLALIKKSWSARQGKEKHSKKYRNNRNSSRYRRLIPWNGRKLKEKVWVCQGAGGWFPMINMYKDEMVCHNDTPKDDSMKTRIITWASSAVWLSRERTRRRGSSSEIYHRCWVFFRLFLSRPSATKEKVGKIHTATTR